jgi:hypothetical protein
MSLAVARRMRSEAWQDGDRAWVDIHPRRGPAMRVTHQVLGSLPGGPWPPENPYPVALRQGGPIFGLGAAEGDPDTARLAYSQALIAVDVLQDVAPSSPELPELLARLDRYGQAISAMERGGGTVASTVGHQIEIDARTALRDATRRKQLFSGLIGAAVVGAAALGGYWYIKKR